MFEYLEPDASDSQETGSLPPPPRAANKGTRSLNPEKVRHILYGSLAAIDRTIKILHAYGYADPNDWSDPIPVPPSSAEATDHPNQWMVIMTKTLLIE
jgi:hypothetical protein